MKNLSGKPFVLLGVHTLGPSPQELKRVMDKENLNWRTFADGRAIADLWSARSTPSYYAIDHRGIIRHKWFGYPGEETIDAAIESLIAEAEGPGDN